MHLLDIQEPGARPEAVSPAIGIDLGTTHSLVAISRAGVAEVLADEEGRTLLPSVLRWAGEGVEIGHHALRATGTKDVVIRSIKRLMGKGASEAPEHLKPYLKEQNDGMARLVVQNRELTPVEISAHILAALKARAENALGATVTQAVITVPAYFDDAARAATKDAAKLAGLDVLRLLNEPTAAALAYGLDQGKEGIYAVYDLGGGTFDISILNLQKGVFQVLATGGDTALGGDDIDQHMLDYVRQKYDLDELSDLEQASLLLACRAAKECLSDTQEAEISWNGQKLAFTQMEVENVAEQLLAQTFAIAQESFGAAKLEPQEVEGVLLVGGMTRMPLLRRKVQEFFGKEPITSLNPDEIVAVGAARQAEALTEGSDTLLLDVLPLSLGLELMGGIAEKILWRNTPIPVKITQEFTTYQDGQTGLKLHVVQGEREMAADCRSLAQFELTGIPPQKAGMARVAVSFIVDADGILTVTAKEEITGVEQRVEVKPSYGLTEAEMEAMLRESMERAKEDITARLLAEAKVDAERLLKDLDIAMHEDSDLLTDKERHTIIAQIAQLQKFMQGTDRERIDLAREALDLMAKDFAERRMSRAVGKVLKGTSVDAY